jgi:small-conductance mechanosensitive channel
MEFKVGDVIKMMPAIRRSSDWVGVTGIIMDIRDNNKYIEIKVIRSPKTMNIAGRITQIFNHNLLKIELSMPKTLLHVL